MGIVYHGSKVSGLKRLEPRKSTHGTYVYATPEKVLALHFSKRCGDDLTYSIGHFEGEKGPWILVENIPGAFDKMYSNSSSIYTFSNKTFENIHTGFEEVVSKVGVDVLSEEKCPNVWDGLLEAERQGLLKIYRYPNKPLGMKNDGSDILDKWRYYKYKLEKEFEKYDFDRLVYLYPNLLIQINELAKEFGYDYSYTKDDLVNIFEERIKRQLKNPDYEQYLESAYINICKIYPELKESIDKIINKYKDELRFEIMLDIKTPQDILKFMDSIEYGYIDMQNKVKHVNNLTGFRTYYRTLSCEQILNNKVGTCIEQVLLMHKLLDSLNIPNKMFCTRVYESGDIDKDAEEHMHCFILYYDQDGVHQIEHPNGERKGIYDFPDEETAIKEINKIYIEMSGGVARPVTEFFDVTPGLTFAEFNDYINSLDEDKKVTKR